jgi:anti-sigma factor RsiW
MNCAEIATLSPLYLSGELDAERTAEVGAHLRICPACARDIEQQRDLDARVRGALLAELRSTGTLEPRIHRSIAVARAKRRVMAVGLVAAGMVLAAGFFFYRFVAPPVSALAMDAVRDHRREVIEKRVKKWRSDAREIDALAQRQSIPANTIQALARSGYRLDRARLCRLAGSLYMHLVYTDGTREMSVFLRPRQGVGAPMLAQNLDAESVVAVESSGMTVVCVAEESQAAMKLARSVAAAL